MTALRADLPSVNAQVVHAVIAQIEPHKQRYCIVGECVRANYGHSTTDRVVHTSAAPPDALLHGTSASAVDRILTQGLMPMQRQYVHLTLDSELAITVGARHGKPCLIRVDAHRAHADGVVFYQANAAFWLAKHIAPTYLKVLGG